MSELNAEEIKAVHITVWGVYRTPWEEETGDIMAATACWLSGLIPYLPSTASFSSSPSYTQEEEGPESSSYWTKAEQPIRSRVTIKARCTVSKVRFPTPGHDKMDYCPL